MLKKKEDEDKRKLEADHSPQPPQTPSIVPSIPETSQGRPLFKDEQGTSKSATSKTGATPVARIIIPKPPAMETVPKPKQQAPGAGIPFVFPSSSVFSAPELEESDEEGFPDVGGDPTPKAPAFTPNPLQRPHLLLCSPQSPHPRLRLPRLQSSAARRAWTSWQETTGNIPG